MKYTKEQLEEAVANSFSYASVLKYLNIKLAGGSQSHWKRVIQKLDINTSHFTGQAHGKGKQSGRRKSADEILIVNIRNTYRPEATKLRRALTEIGVPYRCKCGLENKWQEQDLVLEIDHIDGNYLDSRKENLQYLCPNCHSQKTKNSTG